MQLQTSQNQTITLAKEIARGGEGQIWTVQNRPNDVAKIYDRAKITPVHEVKLKAMLLNPPMQPPTHKAIAWPLETLYERGRFVGYIMPLVQGSEPIFNFYHPIQRQQNQPGFNWLYSHRTAFNLAIAMQAIHDKGHLIGDVNESNILVNPNTFITLVDTDSFQIKSQSGQFYRCLVGKPEYTPPELQGVNFKTVDRRVEHDLFGLAVLNFQLLMQGFHPFAGVLPPGSPSVGRVDLHCIKQGIFPHQKKRATPPPKAPYFNILHSELQTLFIRCFVDGHKNPSQRPTAREWQRALDTAETALTTCQRDPNHVYSNHLKSCPWCVPVPSPKPSPNVAQQRPLPPPVVLPKPSANPVIPVARTTSSSWHGSKTTMLKPSTKPSLTPPPSLPNPVIHQPALPKQTPPTTTPPLSKSVSTPTPTPSLPNPITSQPNAFLHAFTGNSFPSNPISPPQSKTIKRPWVTGAIGLIILLIDELQNMSFKSKLILGAIGLIIFVSWLRTDSQIPTPKSAISPSCSYVTEIPQAECQDLVDLYNSTHGANWRDKTGWLATTTPCSWYGITCEAGHVTVIDLGYNSSAEGNNLRGTIPNFTNLPKLQSLNLSMNHLSGAIPNFNNLPNLNGLYLYTNQLNGTIPNFSNRPNLTYLVLYDNQLSGLIPNFSNLPNLTRLDLSNNRLSGAIPKFTNLPKLEYLYLNDNKLYDAIPDLDWASFDDVKLNNNCNLVAYDDAQAAVLSRQDSRWQELNPVCASAPKSLPTHTPTPVSPTATHSSLIFTPLPRPALIISANCNSVTEIPTVECEELVNFYNISNGVKWKNKIDWLVTNKPCTWYGITCRSRHVTEIKLSSNQLSGTIPNFSNLSNLKLLILSDNQLSGTIPNFTNLPNLQWLYLSNNQLSGAIPNFTNLPKLKLVWLDNNQLSGTIPQFNKNILDTLVLHNNCGLVVYDNAQAVILYNKDPNWDRQGDNCP